MSTEHFHYNKIYLNSYSEIPLTKKKSTMLCSDAVKHNKNIIKEYKEKPKKVIYHDNTFKEIKTTINYDELSEILSNDNVLLYEDKGINYSDKESNIIFDGNFEQGNLNMVIEIENQTEYDVIIRKDYGGYKLYPWFFFSLTINNIQNFISNNKTIETNEFLCKAFKKGEIDSSNQMHSIKINIINLVKDSTYFGSNISVLIYNDYQNKWSRNTYNIFYFSNGIFCQRLKNMNNCFQTLTFSFGLPKFTEPVNKIKFYFAHNYPYTYTQLRLFINSLNVPKTKNFIKFDSLGKTILGVNIPLLIITDFTCSEEELKKKKCVLLTARIHPGEISGSFVI
ncbi:MAG: hypothetical protein MJ252_24180, partial [archaeon]|nr:hypothetical protein [archaeon]